MKIQYLFANSIQLIVCLVLRLLFFPIPINSTFRTCSHIGLLDEGCEVLLPSGRLNHQDIENFIGKMIDPKECDNYLVSGWTEVERTYMHVYTSKVTSKKPEIIKPKIFYCSTHGLCGEITFLYDENFPKECFRQFEDAEFTMRLQYIKNKELRFGECSSKTKSSKGYLYGTSGTKYIVLDNFPETIVLTSLFYSLTIGSGKSPMSYLFQDSKIVQNAAPIILAYDG